MVLDGPGMEQATFSSSGSLSAQMGVQMGSQVIIIGSERSAAESCCTHRCGASGVIVD